MVMADLHCRPRRYLHRRPTTYLPPEIQLFHILPRLPAKSIFRFMSVSKQWHSFIKTPLFAKMHLRHATEDVDHHNHQKLLLLNFGWTHGKFSTIDCEAPEDGLGVIHRLPFKYVRDSSIKILASFHGLVCVAIYKFTYKNLRTLQYSDIILWNPSTGDHKTVSKGSSHDEEYYSDRGGAFGLYYASSDDDYKLLRITYSYDAYVYSLRSDSWRKLEPTCMDDVERKLPWQSSIYKTPNTVVLNDKLYIWKDVGFQHSIIRFDIKTEKFTEMAIPSCIRSGGISTYFNFSMVIKGYIHLFVARQDLNTDLWRMDGDDERWTKVGSSCYLPSIPGRRPLEPVHSLIRNGNWLINSVATSSLYELDSETLATKFMCSYASRGFHNPSRNKFIVTLVSPNQYID